MAQTYRKLFGEIGYATAVENQDKVKPLGIVRNTEINPVLPLIMSMTVRSAIFALFDTNSLKSDDIPLPDRGTKTISVCACHFLCHPEPFGIIIAVITVIHLFLDGEGVKVYFMLEPLDLIIKFGPH